tara:strand:- start:1344 stop:1904 length:561 start_codon:yes stop_codon:yes gene_type:complete
MSETLHSNKYSKKKGPSQRELSNMPYMEILEHYIQYPHNNLKFTHTNFVCETPSALPGNKGGPAKMAVAKSKFLTEEEKADGWRQVFPYHVKYRKFLQTNLHHLPPHLWGKMKPFYDNKVLVGYKAKDNSINFFIHIADTDEISKKLFNEVYSKKPNIETLKELVGSLDIRGIESWLIIKANKMIN